MSMQFEYGSLEYAACVRAAEAEAEHRYIDLPYHNFAHAQHTRDVAVQLAVRCIDNGLDVDVLAIEMASLYHDVDYHKPLPPSVRSRELRSSRIAGAAMRRLGIAQPTILTAQSGIRATELGKPCRTIEDKILRRADLDNLTSNYPSFLLNTYRLYNERRYFNGGQLPSLSVFLFGSVTVLRKYLEVNLTLGDFDHQSFMSQAIINVKRLERETPNSFLARLDERFINQAVSL